jgi:hypothetical protein
MAKKLSFDNLPSAIEKILDILSSEGSEHTALPEIVERITLLEKKLDYLQRAVSPDKPVMDMHEVCRALKLRPKAVSELARSGVLISREQGKKTVYYEDSVVKCFMSGAAWKEATATTTEVSTLPHRPGRPGRPPKVQLPVSETATIESPATETTDGQRRVDVNAACDITDRNPAAIYQLIKGGRIPHYKDGRKVYFFADELRRWAEANPARKYKKRK